MPLRDEKRSSFNQSAVQEFFCISQYYFYGFLNFLFDFIDTSYYNVQIYFPLDMFHIIFSALQDYLLDTIGIF